MPNIGSTLQIYWLAPLAASVVTPIVYRAVFYREVVVAQQPETVQQSEMVTLQQNGQSKDFAANAV